MIMFGITQMFDVLTATLATFSKNTSSTTTQNKDVATTIPVQERGTSDMSVTPVSEIDGIGNALSKRLHENGIETTEDLRETSVNDLQNIKSIGPKKASRLKETY